MSKNATTTYFHERLNDNLKITIIAEDTNSAIDKTLILKDIGHLPTQDFILQLYYNKYTIHFLL